MANGLSHRQTSRQSGVDGYSSPRHLPRRSTRSIIAGTRKATACFLQLVSILVAAFFFAIVGDSHLHHIWGDLGPATSAATEAKTPKPATSMVSVDPSCGFSQHQYRLPLHHEGLPQLMEVFSTDDSVYFAALNPGVCEPEWRATNSSTSSFFHDMTHDTRYICEFADGTRVTSDPLPAVKPNDFWTTAILMIRCDIPDQFLKKSTSYLKGAHGAPLTVSLFATIDLETDYDHEEPLEDWKYPSSAELGVYRNLHVCPREWPDLSLAPQHNSVDTGGSAIPPRRPPRRTLSMVTQILMEYETFEYEDRARVAIPPENIITWIEYHNLIGFEHFYIFDNDPQQHGPLEWLLKPHIEEGLVTYVWYPMRDCFRKSNDELDGSRITISQAFSSMTALRRYDHETEFMGHMDVDEYLQLIPSSSNNDAGGRSIPDVKDLLRDMPADKSVLFAKQKWYHDCHPGRRRRLNTPSSSSVLQRSTSLFPLTKHLCISSDSTPGKSIMRTKDILGIFVHSPWVKTDGTLFDDWSRDVVELDEVFLAHVRNRRARDGIPIRALEEPRPFVVGEPLQMVLDLAVEKRMAQFKTQRHLKYDGEDKPSQKKTEESSEVRG